MERKKRPPWIPKVCRRFFLRFFALLHTRHSSPLHSPLSQYQGVTNRGSPPRFLPSIPKRLKRSPHGFRLATSLFLSPYADIPTFSASMSRMREQKVRFLSLFSLQTRERLSPCLERVVYTNLIAKCRGFRRDPVRHCFHFFTLRHSPAL